MKSRSCVYIDFNLVFFCFEFCFLYSLIVFSLNLLVAKSESRRRSQVVSGVLQKIKAKLETKIEQIEIPGLGTRSSSPEPVEPGKETSMPQASDGNEVNSSKEKSIFQRLVHCL